MQTLNGAQSLAFVRQRHGLDNGDLDRTHRQQAFLASVTHKLSNAGTFANVGQLRSLIAAASKDVVVDNGWNIGAFIPRASNLTGGNVAFNTLPILRFDTIDGQDVNVVNQPALAEQVQVTFGLRPAPTPPAPLPTGPLTIDVLNAGATPGLAGSVAQALTGGTWSRGTIGNTTTQPTAVRFGPAPRRRQTPSRGCCRHRRPAPTTPWRPARCGWSSEPASHRPRRCRPTRQRYAHRPRQHRRWWRRPARQPPPPPSDHRATPSTAEASPASTRGRVSVVRVGRTVMLLV